MVVAYPPWYAIVCTGAGWVVYARVCSTICCQWRYVLIMNLFLGYFWNLCSWAICFDLVVLYVLGLHLSYYALPNQFREVSKLGLLLSVLCNRLKEFLRRVEFSWWLKNLQCISYKMFSFRDLNQLIICVEKVSHSGDIRIYQNLN